MKPKKSRKLTAKDKNWQKNIEERIKIEKVELDHPKGKERFIITIKQIGKKKKNS